MTKRILLGLAGAAILAAAFAITLSVIDYGVIGTLRRVGQLISP